MQLILLVLGFILFLTYAELASRRKYLKAIVILIIAFTCIAYSTDARAKLLHVFPTEDGIYMLGDDVAHCKDGTSLAVLKVRDQPPIPGCWFVKLDVIWILMSNGRAMAFPLTNKGL